MPHQYVQHQLVIVKLKGFPWWPAIITLPIRTKEQQSIVKAMLNEYQLQNLANIQILFNRFKIQQTDEQHLFKYQYLINFVGDNSFSIVGQDSIQHFQSMDQFMSHKKCKLYKNSIKKAQLIYENKLGFEQLLNEQQKQFHNILNDLDSMHSVEVEQQQIENAQQKQSENLKQRVRVYKRIKKNQEMLEKQSQINRFKYLVKKVNMMIDDEKKKEDILATVRQILIFKTQVQRKRNVEYLTEQNSQPLRYSLINIYQYLKSVLDECKNNKLVVNFYQ